MLRCDARASPLGRDRVEDVRGLVEAGDQDAARAFPDKVFPSLAEVRSAAASAPFR